MKKPPPCYLSSQKSLCHVHSAPRGGINSALGDSFLPQRMQEVQGGEPPPCLRVALSRDLALAFAENPEFPGHLPSMGDIRCVFGDFPTNG